MKTNRHLNPKLKLPLIILGALIIIIPVVTAISSLSTSDTVKSAHKDAGKYKNNSCVVFYPKSSDGKNYAKYICENADEEDATYDYSLIPYGDNYLVDYGDGLSYLCDGEYKLLTIDSINEEGKYILSDYLRYSMKKDEKDEAYTLDFLNDTYYENLDISECKYTIVSSFLDVYFPQYDYTIAVPLKYIASYLDVNLGIEEEDYVKPIYVSGNRDVVCLTFNEGPSISTTQSVIDTLYKYDAVGTFFVIGENVDASTIDIVEDAIAKGNEIGSLTQSGYNLYLYETEEEVKNEIEQPATDLFNGKTGSYSGTGYTMTIYRAPGGDHTKIDGITSLTAIEWDLDVDSSNESTVDSVYETIKDFESKNDDKLNECILKFRDTRSMCSDALEKIIPELIEEGYQLVTVDELLERPDVIKTMDGKCYYPW